MPGTSTGGSKTSPQSSRVLRASVSGEFVSSANFSGSHARELPQRLYRWPSHAATLLASEGRPPMPQVVQFDA